MMTSLDSICDGTWEGGGEGMKWAREEERVGQRGWMEEEGGSHMVAR